MRVHETVYITQVSNMEPPIARCAKTEEQVDAVREERGEKLVCCSR